MNAGVKPRDLMASLALDRSNDLGVRHCTGIQSLMTIRAGHSPMHRGFKCLPVYKQRHALPLLGHVESLVAVTHQADIR